MGKVPGVLLNAKLAKTLRRIAIDVMKPGSPESLLLAKPVKLKGGGEATVAVNAQASVRGAIRRLKDAYEKHPEVRAHVQQLESYRQMLRAQVASGGPLFQKPEGGS